jgi:chromosome segregation ATPase
MVLKGVNMQKPEFNDEFAKTKLREHKKFGGKVVEILYGAHDAEGKAVAPREGADDGHGRWYGIEVNGDYRMFVWTHSREEGGNTEYGTEYKEDGIDEMENQLQKKWDLVKEAEQIARNAEDEEDGARLAEIRKEYDAIKDWDTPVEKARDGYDARLKSAEEELTPRLENQKANKELKQAIADKAEALKDATNFRNARNEVSKLKDQLAEVGTAGAKADAAFRKSLNDIDRDLRDKQREYFANREANQAKAAETKKEIISKTKELVNSVKNYKQTGEKLNALFDEWKAAGSAGHETDEELWAQFNETRQKFYDARSKFFAERKEAFAKSAEIKNKLIEEAKELAAKNDFSRKITDRMKELDQEWKAAGTSGKDNDALWKTFSDAKEVFWDGKQAAFRKTLSADLEKKEAELESLKKENEDLSYKIEIAPNPALRDTSERQLSANEDKADQLEDEIEDLKKRIAE